MIDRELYELTISQASNLIAQRKISPVELANAYLKRIEQVDPELNSFITVTGEAALKFAHLMEAEIFHGGLRGDLHGIPLALKDLYETKGVRTTAGSLFFRDYIPEQDAAIVEKLHAAGAVFLGKLNMHEIALGVTNVNPHYGACRNPWDTVRVAGGSSGGSAAALAGRLCAGSLGTDTGGSIRIPAALCGIVGLKPTYGRVSVRGVIPLSWNLDHAGPMARTVRDAAILLQFIAGYDMEDPYSVNVPVDDYLTNLELSVKDLRIAVASSEYFTSKSEPQVLRAFEESVGVFNRLGAHIERVELLGIMEAAKANGLMTPSDAAAFHAERLLENPQGFGEDVRQRLEIGAAFTSTEYILARQMQSLKRYEFDRFFQEFDLLLTPTTPVVAPTIVGPDAIKTARLLTRFTAPFNLSGLPALSLPCGFSKDGLPIGLQIVSRAWNEALVLRAGFAFERETSWHLEAPAMN